MPLVHRFIEDELALRPTHRSTGDEDEEGVTASEEQEAVQPGTMAKPSGMDPEDHDQQASVWVEHVGKHAQDV